MRYTVERKPDMFETVPANSFEIKDGWVLFYQINDALSRKLVIGFPSREVVSFFPDEDQ